MGLGFPHLRQKEALVEMRARQAGQRIRDMTFLHHSLHLQAVRRKRNYISFFNNTLIAWKILFLKKYR
jgi:hypothetical protein